jgi:hypothetical protein
MICFIDDIPFSVKKDLITMVNTAFKFFMKSMEKKQLLVEEKALDHRNSMASG